MNTNAAWKVVRALCALVLNVGALVAAVKSTKK